MFPGMSSFGLCVIGNIRGKNRKITEKLLLPECVSRHESSAGLPGKSADGKCTRRQHVDRGPGFLRKSVYFPRSREFRDGANRNPTAECAPLPPVAGRPTRAQKGRGRSVLKVSRQLPTWNCHRSFLPDPRAPFPT